MIKTKLAFLKGRLLSSQSEQSEKFSKSPDWLEKSQPSKKPLLFWSCKQAKYRNWSIIARCKFWTTFVQFTYNFNAFYWYGIRDTCFFSFNWSIVLWTSIGVQVLKKLIVFVMKFALKEKHYLWFWIQVEDKYNSIQ